MKTGLSSNDPTFSVGRLADNLYRLSGYVSGPKSVLTLKIGAKNLKVALGASDKADAVLQKLTAALPKSLKIRLEQSGSTFPPQFDISIVRADAPPPPAANVKAEALKKRFAELKGQNALTPCVQPQGALDSQGVDLAPTDGSYATGYLVGDHAYAKVTVPGPRAYPQWFDLGTVKL